MSDKTILVTGGAGFIGSNFARHLYRKYPEYRSLVVDALTYAGSVSNLPEGAQQSGRYEFWYGDVRNGELMDTLVSRADVVVHMAAESHVPLDLRQPPLLRDGRPRHADRGQRRHQVSRPGRALHPRLHLRGLRLRPQRADGRGAPAESSEPVCLGQVRRRPARLLLLGDLSDSGGS